MLGLQVFIVGKKQFPHHIIGNTIASCRHLLFGEKMLPVYSLIVVVFILVGSTLKVDLVWALADLFNGLMAVPNLLALLALSGVVVAIDRK